LYIDNHVTTKYSATFQLLDSRRFQNAEMTFQCHRLPRGAVEYI